MKSVQQISKARFKISTPGVLQSEILLDFNPIIEKFELEGNFDLIHWQARPKGYREYGIYSSKDDSYRSTDYLPTSYGGLSLLQLDDKTASTLPSAVIHFQGLLKQ